MIRQIIDFDLALGFNDNMNTFTQDIANNIINTIKTRCAEEPVMRKINDNTKQFVCSFKRKTFTPINIKDYNNGKIEVIEIIVLAASRENLINQD